MEGCGNTEASFPSSSAARCTAVAEAAVLRSAHCGVRHVLAQLISASNPSPPTWSLKAVFLHHLHAASGKGRDSKCLAACCHFFAALNQFLPVTAQTTKPPASEVVCAGVRVISVLNMGQLLETEVVKPWGISEALTLNVCESSPV